MFSPINDNDLKAKNGGFRGGFRPKIHPVTKRPRVITGTMTHSPIRTKASYPGPGPLNIAGRSYNPGNPGMSALKKASIVAAAVVTAGGGTAGGLALSDLDGGTHFYGDRINDSSDE